MHDKWLQRFIELALEIAGWSKDPSTKVGAVVADGKEVLGLGYNGFPRGVDDLDERYNDRPTKYAMIVHAEANALIAASVHGRKRLVGSTLYTTKPPCSECVKLLLQFELGRIVCAKPDADDPSVARWHEDQKAARQMLEDAGVDLVLI